jgi:hypothetical protein
MPVLRRAAENVPSETMSLLQKGLARPGERCNAGHGLTTAYTRPATRELSNSINRTGGRVMSGVRPEGEWRMLMDENLKYRREMIFKVLAWGTFVLFLVWGYSLTQSNSFELLAPYEKNFRNLVQARTDEAKEIEDTAKTHADRVKAAQMRLDIHLAEELRDDSQRRAIGLICGTLIYCVIYPILVWGVYKRTAPGDCTTDKDVAFSLRHALIFAIIMSLATFITAFLTALF